MRWNAGRQNPSVQWQAKVKRKPEAKKHKTHHRDLYNIK